MNPTLSPSGSGAKNLVATLAAQAWWMCLLVALGVLWLGTARRIARVEALTNSPTWSVDAPRRDAGSPTGFERGQRRLIVAGHHDPTFGWIIEAQLAVAHGSWRLRRVEYDAAPDGREIGRTALYRWWLIAVGWIHGTITGEPLGYAIERGALVADPVLLALLLIGGAAYAARYLGRIAAIGFVLAGTSLFPLAANFQPGAPDPHSLAWVFAVGSVLPLLGMPEQIGPRMRIHFVLAGICGGLGFWNDATTQAPVLLAILPGGIFHELIRSRRMAATPPAASPWRAWAVAGALTTLAASGLEFAPNHFSGSLDSVNPIHAVAWLGGGEILHAVATWSRAGRLAFDRRALVQVGLAVLALAAWPVVGRLSNSGGLLASDFNALELANHPRGEFAPSLRDWLHRPGGVGVKWATLLPCGLLLVALGRVCFGRLDRAGRSRLALVTTVALFAAVLACQQLRWWNLFDALALAVLAVLLADVKVSNLRAHRGTFAAALLVVPGFFVGFPPAFAGPAVNDVSPPEAQALIARDFSHWLARRSESGRNLVFSTPIVSSAMAYYGGFDVVVSSDDANASGHLTAVRIASASTEQEVAVLLKSRGITHLVLPLWDPALDRLVRVGRNLLPGQPLPANAFAVALRDWEIPLWIRPMNYMIPKETGFAGGDLRAFALQAEQEADLALSRLADLFLERGQLAEARSVSQSLEAYPRSVAALGAIAAVDFAARDATRLAESLAKLIPHLSRRAARNLPADRRISLATLLIRNQHADLARDQVAAIFSELDAETLRGLSSAAVVNLLILSRTLDQPFPTPELAAVAMELIPPAVRTRLTQKP